MDTDPTIYNPFRTDDRQHFPSFDAAFGELIQIEFKNIEKDKERVRAKDRKSKSNDNAKTIKPPKSKESTLSLSIVTTTASSSSSTSSMLSLPSSSLNTSMNPHTPIPSKGKTTHKFKAKPPQNTKPLHHDLNNLQTPISQKKNTSKLKMKSTHLHPQSYSNYNNHTPIPSKPKQKVHASTSSHTPSQSQMFITPAAQKKKKRIKDTPNPPSDSCNESGLIQLSQLFSPCPNQGRYELSSPAPNDKNARLLTKTPAKFPIVLPATPVIKQDINDSITQKWCNEYFKKHEPILTPVHKRANPVRLYDPSKDVNATMLLKQSEASFTEKKESDNEGSPENATDLSLMIGNPMPLNCDISMIRFSKDNRDKEDDVGADNVDNINVDESFGFFSNDQEQDTDDKAKTSTLWQWNDNDNDDINDSNNNSNIDTNAGSIGVSFSSSFSSSFADVSSIMRVGGETANNNDSQTPITERNESKISCPLSFGSNPLSDIKKPKTKSKIVADSQNEVDEEKETSFKDIPLTPMDRPHSFDSDLNKKSKNEKDDKLKSRSKSIDSLEHQFSSIKLNKTQKKTDHNIDNKNNNNKEEVDGDEELLTDCDVLSDKEFFGTTEDHATQTNPVWVFDEADSHRIRYDGKLLSEISRNHHGKSVNQQYFMSMSAIYSNDADEEELNVSSGSIKSAQSDKILYSNIYNTNRPLRHNRDSIEVDLMLNLHSDESDTENLHKLPVSVPIRSRSSKTIKQLRIQNMIKTAHKLRNNYKKKPKSQQMLKQYKQSKLALNPNHTVCIAHNERGDLV